MTDNCLAVLILASTSACSRYALSYVNGLSITDIVSTDRQPVGAHIILSTRILGRTHQLWEQSLATPVPTDLDENSGP